MSAAHALERGPIEGYAVFAIRLIIGGIFLVAGVLKVGHAPEFAAQIAGFQLGIPQPVIAPAALVLPFLEIMIGAYLIVGLFTRAAAWCATVLLAIFDLAIASAVVRGLTVSCGCFGPNDKTVTTWPEVARDAVFVVLALAIALRGPGTLALDRRIGNAP